MADESVVVLKSRPKKAGNRLEDKTGMTNGLFIGADMCQKPYQLRREEVYSNVLETYDECEAEHKPPDVVEHVISGEL